MRSVESLWFEVAVVMSIFAIGNILFGHFEEHKPKWQRLLKVAVILTLVLGISATVGRGWAVTFLGALLVVPLVIHGWWLPKHGVNGWTGEPNDRYYELIGHSDNEFEDGSS